MAEPMVNTGERTGGQITVDILLKNGIDRAFCVPGESYLGVLNAIRDAGESFDLVVCRHEGGAAYMAEAYARATGKPGVCLVTRGPGACNASIGVMTAQHEATPMILIVGHVSRGTEGRGAFQEIDPKAMFGGMAKWVVTIEQADQVESVMTRALHIARSGRPAPVVVALSEDMQFELAPAATSAPVQLAPVVPPDASIEQLACMLTESNNPLVVAGGSNWTSAARESLAVFAARFDLPVASTFRRQYLMDNEIDNYCQWRRQNVPAGGVIVYQSGW